MKIGAIYKEQTMTNYQGQDIEYMKISAQARNVSRLQELIDFAKLSGFQKIGIANCFSMEKYAQNLRHILESSGFEVCLCNCRQSGIDACDISPELHGPTCDPLAQAEYLNECQTDFNINFGLCLGHGLIFQKHSIAPVTTLIVKDVATAHKTIESLCE